LEEHYQNLGLGKGETLTEERVRAAYRQAALRWHPDRHPGAGKEAAEARFKAASMSFETLMAHVKG
jgi:curved DNA-binding protein CbpA